jgi:hypothetical protein
MACNPIVLENLKLQIEGDKISHEHKVYPTVGYENADGD